MVEYTEKSVKKIILKFTQKAGMQGAQPLAGGSVVSPELLSPLCLPPKEASYEWMSGSSL